ncbi:ribonucleotide reductase subunit 1 [Columbid alphaherpesvirus 1]|uniref:Ribonucleoside-diphosphate reductase large subunit n=1 Tax=Columbid alphaherpesvirus 1 TaxID=93386 RepID=A0A1V0M8I7_9ALPH|nr:ribonucleotide reductase subunit 1 [Columbid alphaherpesvirus 1]ARD71364.1 ribonucleotide reductase subunit 1 [Columbid alphaherpesvirus 1]
MFKATSLSSSKRRIATSDIHERYVRLNLPRRASIRMDPLNYKNMKFASSIAVNLSAVEEDLRGMGHLEGPAFLGKDGRLLSTGMAPSLKEIRARITSLVNGLKAKCRVDERLYMSCGELVHLRIATREVPFDAWLESKELGLFDEVIKDIRENKEFVEATIDRFYGGQFTAVKHTGLQSALKYEDVYLSDLENGQKESMGQFFARMAAAAATEAMKTTQFASALVSGPASWDSVFSTFFWALAQQLFIPATPVMLFLGRKDKSTASCYLVDSRTKDNDTTIHSLSKQVVPLLVARGGVGLSLQRFNNSKLGIMHILKLLDSLIVASNVDSVRPTGLCVYFEPWHSDIMSVLNMRGSLAAEESRRCDNLFAALWVCDLLFKRYMRYAEGEDNVKWTLFDSRADVLSTLHGEEFERQYEEFEEAGIGVASIPIRDMIFAIIKSAVFTGSPFIMFKDACNRHYHLDTQGDALSGSNLCTEIIQKTDENTNGVCSLVSINLPKCVRGGATGKKRVFNYTALRHAVRVAAVFVNTTMQCTTRPTQNSANGIARHRSIGIGVQGLHTALLAMGMDMADDDARAVNKRIFEVMLLEAMNVSCDFCELGLDPFPEFNQSKYARGRLHFDAWDGVELTEPEEWKSLRARVMSHGLYNSQFVALMPTASSAQVTEVSEGFSPLFSNMFSKVTLAGELLRPNLLFMEELRSIYADDEGARIKALDLLESSGWSVKAALGDRPECAPLMKYKTAFEYDQSLLIDLCRDRAPFVDQSQSMTLFVTEMADGTLPASRVMSLLLHGYKAGLKTGMYYCKIRKATNSGVFSGSGELVCTTCHL